MNGHPRDQAKVSVHCRWPLIRGTDGHVEMSRDIDNVAVNSRWPLTMGVAQGRYYCTTKFCRNGLKCRNRFKNMRQSMSNYRIIIVVIYELLSEIVVRVVASLPAV